MMEKQEGNVCNSQSFNDSTQALDIEDIKFKTQDNSKTKYKCGAVVGIFVVLAAVAGLVAWAVLRNDVESPSPIAEEEAPVNDIPEAELRRIDCYPETGGGVSTVDQAKCEARGCIWQLSEQVNVPACYVPQPESEQEFGYRVISRPEDTEFGQRWFLQRINEWAIYDENIEFVTFDIEYRDNHLLRFKFDDTNNSGRFKVPVPLQLGSVRAPNPVYEVQVQQNGTFSFKIIRRATNTVLWDTSVGGFAFANQFLQISSRLPSENIYGMGENLHFSFKHNLDFQTWPLWSRDQPPHSEDETKNLNLYSVHPFYECLEEDGNSHGVLLLNANAMDYTLTPLPMLTYKTIGGILDFYMFMGPGPENVVQQYTGAVGKPYMPPYFMLGFQISRYGYRDTNMIRESVDRTLAYDIPYDVQYVDIDHMYKNRDFTLDMENFGDLPEYFTELRQMGLKTVIILDPTLEINDTYTPYLEGVAENIFIQWPDRESMPEGDYEEYNRTDMMGSVWPEWKCVFPDFFLNETAALWTKWLVDFRQRLPFDVLWLDMNEPANFDTNKWRPWNWPIEEVPINWTLKCSNNSWDDPPYRTKAAYLFDDPNEGLEERLSSKTVCMIGTQEQGKAKHYDLHNLYGWKQTSISLDSLREAVLSAEGVAKRSMLVTRSTFTGSAQHAGRWLGDNTSRWKDLRLSIIGMLEFNIMGFPYVGADICGYFENCTAELCKRWQEVGAFYPYSRNHNHEDPHHQDPAFYGPEVVDPTKNALQIRYTLLPYLYTLFHRAHVHGDTVIRPLFHQFPTDNNTWSIERQFLWGAAVLFSPILEEGQTVLSHYFPRGRWYDWYTNSVVSEGEGEWRSVPVDQDTFIQVHVRGGHILPWQIPANNTHFSRRNAFGVKAALDSLDGQANGAVFWDDGDSIDTYENGHYYAASYAVDTNLLEMNVEHNGTVEGLDVLVLDTVQVMGVSQASFIYVNNLLHTDFTFNTETQYLEITNLQLPMIDNFEIEWRASARPLQQYEETERLDCCPESCDQTGCEAKNCVWTESSIAGVPWCYLNNEIYGYSGVFVGEEDTYTTWKGQSSMFGGDIQQVKITTKEYNYIYRIKLEDYNDPNRYEVPLALNLEDDGPDDLFNLQMDFEPTFTIRLTRTGDDTGLLDTSIGGFTMADQFLQLSTRLASTNVYGFGEHIHPALKHNLQDYNTWSMFARDEPPKGNGANLYSTHPFYMVVEGSGRCHGVLLWNSNAMEVGFLPSPGLTLRTVGGIMDVYVVIGDTPEQLLQRYHQLIGFAYLPPYWALGFQLSRYGYDTLDKMQSVVERNLEANIPLDVVYLDIDSLEEHKSFTWDREAFAGLPDYLDYLHSIHVRNIVIIDPFLISNDTDYPPYDLGLQGNLFVKWPQGTSPDYNIHNNDDLLGWAWPTGYCVFPDFFHTNSTAYWELLIQNYHQQLHFDGLWLDMNEPANFGTNEDKPWNWPEDVLPYWSLKCPQNNSWDNPPYRPASLLGEWLCDKTICMTALQGDTGSLRHYNVHSLYGHTQTLPTLSGLRKSVSGERGLVITRSTFPGTGVHGGRWLGDNAAVWSHLKDSIIGMLEFNFFGIPYVGADICGYFDSCPEELCQRWQQLGAFYPYSRNHNGLGYDDQDPGAFSAGMQASTRKALQTRYSLLPYLYTLFYWAHTHGGTVTRPLFHEFATDSRALEVDEQFLWGPALLISPVLKQGEIYVNAYFPDVRWFDFYTGGEIEGTGRAHVLDAPLDHIPLHVRGGHVIPMQEPANTTHHSRGNAFALLIVPDSEDQAEGDLFWDDGHSVDTVINNIYCRLHFNFSQTAVAMTVVQRNSPDLDSLELGLIRVFGVTESPDTVTSDPPSESLTFTYNPDTKVLSVEEIHISMATEFVIRWE